MADEPAEAPAPRRPNILHILSDQHTAAVLGCYGDPIVATPNLGRLAAGDHDLLDLGTAATRRGAQRSAVTEGHRHCGRTARCWRRRRRPGERSGGVGGRTCERVRRSPGARWALTGHGGAVRRQVIAWLSDQDLSGVSARMIRERFGVPASTARRWRRERRRAPG